MKSQSVSINDIPQDVWKAWLLRSSPIGVGVEGIKFIEATIEKYPEYFEWEVTFNAIPESVYEAYLDEVYPDRHKNVDWKFEDYRNNNGKGILETIRENTIEYKPMTTEEMVNVLTDIHNKEIQRKQEEIKEDNRRRKIWNKHYKKYGLKYRSDALHF